MRIQKYQQGRWFMDEAKRDSISHRQDSVRLSKRNPKLVKPTFGEVRKDSKYNDEVNFVMNALRSSIPKMESGVKDWQSSTVEQNQEQISKLKDIAKVHGIIGQMALAGGALWAENAGKKTLSSAFSGINDLWNGIESVQSIKDNDKMGMIQNLTPLGFSGIAALHYLPRFKYTNSMLIDASRNMGNIWDFAINPLIEANK